MSKQTSRSLFAACAAVAVFLAGCSDPGTPFTPAEGGEFGPGDAPAFNVMDHGTHADRHLVMFRAARVPGDFASRITELGGVVDGELAPLGIAIVSDLSESAVKALAGHRDVMSVEPDLVILRDDPFAEDVIEFADDLPLTSHNPGEVAFFFPRQWHLRAISADVAWENGYFGSSETTVAIIDSGIDYNHAALEGLVDLERSVSFLPDEDEELEGLFPGAHPIADMSRHGTHVASTIVSTGQVVAGVTTQTTLFGVKVCRWDGGCPRSAVLRAIVYAADQSADIINISLGGTFFLREDRGNWLPQVLRATNYAHAKGALIVVSAGNDGLDLDHDQDQFKIYCSATNVVCVSGTGPTTRASIDGPWNDVDQFWTGSNYGRSAIDVAAPSGNTNNFVYAACSSFSQRNPNCQNSNRFSIGLRGTSMAAPHASGVAALIVAHSVGKGNPARVRARLHQSADAIDGNGNSAFFGKGRVNAARAVGLD